MAYDKFGKPLYLKTGELVIDADTGGVGIVASNQQITYLSDAVTAQAGVSSGIVGNWGSLASSTISAAPVHPNNVVFTKQGGDEILRIDCNTGVTTFGPGYNNNEEAIEEFWKMVGQQSPDKARKQMVEAQDLALRYKHLADKATVEVADMHKKLREAEEKIAELENVEYVYQNNADGTPMQIGGDPIAIIKRKTSRN